MEEMIISYTLIFVIIILIILSIIYLVLWINSRKKAHGMTKENSKQGKKVKTNSNTNYNKASVFDFMEFDKIEDNMIIQKSGKKYIMVVECQGVNYDLMSRIEKTSVEEGFQQFLNTLRHPIQIYIQTRTINLERSIQNYKSRVQEVEDKYNNMVNEYNEMKESDMYSKQQLDKYLYELTKQKNLLDYGKDIVYNTEKMSLNRNVLNKKYYVIIPYHPDDIENLDKEEIKNMAFSELYTKAQAIIRTLSACSVSGKILSSNELVDLLYVAYNRDESEVYGIEKALRAGYEELYSTSQDVFEKKIRILDNQIRNSAIDLANEKIEKVKSERQKIAEEKEKNMDELITKMAKIILEENKEYVGKDIAEDAIKEIEKGGNGENEEKKSTRGRKKKAN